MTAVARLLLFLLPFAIFALLVVYLRQRQDEGRTISEKSLRRVVAALIAAVAVFVIVAVVSVLTHEDNRDKVYVPPQAVDGEIQPGHFKEPDKDSDKDADNDPQGK